MVSVSSGIVFVRFPSAPAVSAEQSLQVGSGRGPLSLKFALLSEDLLALLSPQSGNASCPGSPSCSLNLRGSSCPGCCARLPSLVGSDLQPVLESGAQPRVKQCVANLFQSLQRSLHSYPTRAGRGHRDPPENRDAEFRLRGAGEERNGSSRGRGSRERSSQASLIF